MAADLATFRTQFPEFASTSDAAINRELAEAVLLHSIRELATLYAAAHLLTLETHRAAGTPLLGEVASSSAGELRVQYRTQAAGAGRDAFWTRTEYGRRFLALEQRSARHAMMARVVG